MSSMQQTLCLQDSGEEAAVAEDLQAFRKRFKKSYHPAMAAAFYLSRASGCSSVRQSNHTAQTWSASAGSMLTCTLTSRQMHPR